MKCAVLFIALASVAAVRGESNETSTTTTAEPDHEDAMMAMMIKGLVDASGMSQEDATAAFGTAAAAVGPVCEAAHTDHDSAEFTTCLTTRMTDALTAVATAYVASLGPDCDSEEAETCSTVCTTCAAACAPGGTLESLDLTADACVNGIVATGSFGCAEGSCGCTDVCLPCAAFISCPAVTTEMATAIKAALAEQDLTAAQIETILTAMAGFQTVRAIFDANTDDIAAFLGDSQLLAGITQGANGLTGESLALFTKAAAAANEGSGEGGEGGDSASAGLFSGAIVVTLAVTVALL